MRSDKKMLVGVAAAAGIAALLMAGKSKGSTPGGGGPGGGSGPEPGARCSTQWAAELAANAIGSCDPNHPEACKTDRIRAAAAEIRKCGTLNEYAAQLEDYADSVDDWLGIKPTPECDPAKLSGRMAQAHAKCKDPATCDTNLLYQVAAELDHCGWTNQAASLRAAADDAIAYKQAMGKG